MTPKAIFFGSIGTLVDSSELQREAFNRAFKDAGLDWHWERDEYRTLLERPGGKRRIEEYARSRGEEVDAEAIHAAKVAHFKADAPTKMKPRDGLKELVEAAIEKGVPMAFVTSTGRDQVDLTLEGTNGVLSRDRLSYVGDRAHVKLSKPAPDIYNHALAEMAVDAENVLVIEDTPQSVVAARDAGLIHIVGFPTDQSTRGDFQRGVKVVDRLSADLLDL